MRQMPALSSMRRQQKTIVNVECVIFTVLILVLLKLILLYLLFLAIARSSRVSLGLLLHPLILHAVFLRGEN